MIPFRLNYEQVGLELSIFEAIYEEVTDKILRETNCLFDKYGKILYYIIQEKQKNDYNLEKIIKKKALKVNNSRHGNLQKQQQQVLV